MTCGNGRVAAPDDHRDVLQDDRDADGGDQRRQPRRAAQRPVGDPLDRVADAMHTGIAHPPRSARSPSGGSAGLAGQRDDHG